MAGIHLGGAGQEEQGGVAAVPDGPRQGALHHHRLARQGRHGKEARAEEEDRDPEVEEVADPYEGPQLPGQELGAGDERARQDKLPDRPSQERQGGVCRNIQAGR